MHEEDCRLPSLDWLIKTYQTIPNPNPLQEIKPLAPLKDQRITNAFEPTTSNAVDYSNHPQKPPYSYSQLIVQAMKHFGGQKVLLTDIYSFIKERYAWYRLCDPSWQNSIRHNLSLNKQFIKIPRSPGDKGKGSYWRLDFTMTNGGTTKSRKPSIRKKRVIMKRKVKTPTETPQLNPAILTFLKENSETISAQSTSSSSTRSSPQIMEIGVEDGRVSGDNLQNSVQCGFPSFTEEFPNEYDSSFEFTSFFTDAEYNPDMNLVLDSCYPSSDPIQPNSRTSLAWSPMENGQYYNYPSPADISLNGETVSGTISEHDVHPWEDNNLNFTDDNLLFDSEL